MVGYIYLSNPLNLCNVAFIYTIFVISPTFESLVDVLNVNRHPQLALAEKVTNPQVFWERFTGIPQSPQQPL